MSWNPALAPHCPKGDAVDLIDVEIAPRARDLGDFEVRRALPAPERQMVGPFIFFDQMGPAEFLTGKGIDVRPHPHIGLATVTYLFRGGLHHRDSLGASAEILPGAVNWMVAGNGITHSERTAAERRKGPSALFGIQTWVALPDAAEETAPAFEHAPKESLPLIADGGAQVRVILGALYGETAPVRTFSEMFYADAALAAGASLPLPDNHEDRGIYILQGAVEIAGRRWEAGRMLVFRPGDAVSLKALEDSRLMLLGGATMEGPRYIWWNFVASSREKIEAAKEAWRAGDWAHGRFRLPPEDDQETIPLPGD